MNECEATANVRSCGPARAILRIGAFFGLTIILSILLHAAINQGARQITTSQFGVWNQAVGGTSHAEIVISGSSRALVHYDAATIQDITGLSAYNFGQNATRTDLQFAFLKTYLEHNEDPAFIIQNLDLHSFALSEEIYIPAQYVPYLNEEEIYAALRRIEPSAWKWRWIPLYGYSVVDMRFTWMTGLKGLVGIDPPEDRILGFNPRYREWTGEFDRFKADNPSGVDIDYESEGIELFDEMVRFCVQRGITIILVYSPEYFEMSALANNRAQIFAIINEIASRYEIEFWDYSLTDITKRRENFYNSQHLNYQGAGEFSRDIGERLLPLIAAGKGPPPTMLSAVEEDAGGSAK